MYRTAQEQSNQYTGLDPSPKMKLMFRDDITNDVIHSKKLIFDFSKYFFLPSITQKLKE